MITEMSELQILIYQSNRSPRSVSINTRTIYRFLGAALAGTVLLLLGGALLLRTGARHWAKSNEHSLPSSAPQETSDLGPTNLPAEQSQQLRDEIDRLQNQLANASKLAHAPREIDKKNPALALFSPLVLDQTKAEPIVMIQHFRYSKGSGKTPTTLTFELHNARPGETTQKGYIVVLGRAEHSLHAYPPIMTESSPFLVDFEKGETFQVARFRLVNAQFDSPVERFQILIFSRKGELLINSFFDARQNGGN